MAEAKSANFPAERKRVMLIHALVESLDPTHKALTSLQGSSRGTASLLLDADLEIRISF